MNKLLTAKTFKKRVLENALPAAVLFKAEWNGACEIIAPVFEQLAAVYQKQIHLYTIDADKETVIAEMYGVMDLPAILFFKHGQVVDYIKGLVPKETITEKINNVLNNL
jgi:thioredoxin 1